MSVIVTNFVAIGQAVSEVWRFFDFFSKWRPPPSWICFVRVWSTRKEYLLLFITVQNMVGIDQ